MPENDHISFVINLDLQLNKFIDSPISPSKTKTNIEMRHSTMACECVTNGTTTQEQRRKKSNKTRNPSREIHKYFRSLSTG